MRATLHTWESDCYDADWGGGGYNAVPDLNPRGVGMGVQEGGGGVSKKCFRFWGTFLNSPFHSEHFENAQVWGIKVPFTIDHKWGDTGRKWGANAVSRSTEAKTVSRAPLAPKSGVPCCSPSVCVCGGGGRSSPARNPPPRPGSAVGCRY